MESKPEILIQISISELLLIEPVWNRNITDNELRHLNQNLLIEPVWNRNRDITLPEVSNHHSFNRTSMESKPRPVSARFPATACF